MDEICLLWGHFGHSNLLLCHPQCWAMPCLRDRREQRQTLTWQRGLCLSSESLKSPTLGIGQVSDLGTAFNPVGSMESRVCPCFLGFIPEHQSVSGPHHLGLTAMASLSAQWSPLGRESKTPRAFSWGALNTSLRIQF